MKVITTKVNKTIGLLRKLPKTQPRLNQAFVRPHLDYGDIIYDEAYNETFHQKLESIQYNACLALSGAIRGSSIENFTMNQVWHPSNVDVGKRNFAYFIRFSKENKPVYLLNLIPTKNSSYNTRNTDKITAFHTKHNFLYITKHNQKSLFSIHRY